MEDPIGKIEALLEETGRRCMRLALTRSLTKEQNDRLIKWMFGCMNQRLTIRNRVAQRGPGELDKVLKFVAKAAETLIEIDQSDGL